MSKKVLKLELPSNANVTVRNVHELRNENNEVQVAPKNLSVDKVFQAKDEEPYTRISLSNMDCDVIIDLSQEDCETIVDWILKANSKD